jgi:uncharacterized membrane protein YfcA
MPFREKSAWISLLVMLGVFGAYFGAILTGRLPPAGLVTFRYLLMSVAAASLLQVALRVIAAMLARSDARAPKDERERLIELKATEVAFYVLLVAALGGMFVALHTPLFGHPPRLPTMGLVTLAAVILADVARSLAIIVRYRLGA